MEMTGLSEDELQRLLPLILSHPEQPGGKQHAG